MNTILIAEDEVRIAAFLAKGLQKNGFTTRVAIDGEQALHLACTAKFDLLLLDLGLPLKDGGAVLQELRQLGYQQPVIVVTAQDDQRSWAAVAEYGVSAYVTKPFQFQELLQRIQVTLAAVA